MKTIYTILLALMLCIGCNSKYEATPRLPPGIISQQTPHLKFYGDVDFTQEDRLELQKAADLWDAQTTGFAHIEIDWSLDFNDALNLLSHQDDNLIINLSDPIVQAEIDCYASHQEFPCEPRGEVLGQTRSDIHQTYPIRVFMMTGRSTGRHFRKVALHEFGHAMGLDHIGDTTAIMFWAASNPENCDDQPSCSNVCLKAADLNQFCSRTGGCKPEDMHPCAP